MIPHFLRFQLAGNFHLPISSLASWRYEGSARSVTMAPPTISQYDLHNSSLPLRLESNCCFYRAAYRLDYRQTT